MCDVPFERGPDNQPIYGMLYGQKVCVECYRKAEKLLVWLESMGETRAEHGCCYSPKDDVWVEDTESESSSDESEWMGQGGRSAGRGQS